MGLFKKSEPVESNDPKRPPKGPASVSRNSGNDNGEKADTPEVRITTTYEIWGTR